MQLSITSIEFSRHSVGDPLAENPVPVTSSIEQCIYNVFVFDTAVSYNMYIDLFQGLLSSCTTTLLLRPHCTPGRAHATGVSLEILQQE